MFLGIDIKSLIQSIPRESVSIKSFKFSREASDNGLVLNTCEARLGLMGQGIRRRSRAGHVPLLNKTGLW